MASGGDIGQGTKLILRAACLLALLGTLGFVAVLLSKDAVLRFNFIVGIVVTIFGVLFMILYQQRQRKNNVVQKLPIEEGKTPLADFEIIRGLYRDHFYRIRLYEDFLVYQNYGIPIIRYEEIIWFMVDPVTQYDLTLKIKNQKSNIRFSIAVNDARKFTDILSKKGVARKERADFMKGL